MTVNFSTTLFKQPLPSDLVSELTKECQDANLSLSPAENDKKSTENDKKSSSWFGWFGKTSNTTNQITEPGKAPTVPTEETETLKLDVDLASEFPQNFSSEKVESDESDEADSEKRFKKTIRLSTEQLKKLNLKRGSNEVEFSVTTAFQGTSRAKCHIYLWHHTDKVSFNCQSFKV